MSVPGSAAGKPTGAAGVRRGFVLAAGLGTRLRPLSAELPKPAWPLFDVPLAALVLAALAAAGVEEAVVNLHHRPDRLRAALEPWVPEGMRVRWSPEAQLLGTGGALGPWRAFLGEGPFFLANADTVQQIDLAAMARRHRQAGAAATLAVHRQEAGRAAPIELGPGGRVVRFLSARAPGCAGGRPCGFTGIHLLEPEVLDALPEGPCCINADVHARRVARGEPYLGYVLPPGAFWSDLGTPRRYLEAHLALLARGRLPARAPGRLVGAEERAEGGGRVVPPSYLGPGARVERGATAGPYAVLGAGATVGRGARVRRSVVWAGARVDAPELDGGIAAPGQAPVGASGL
ncbi:MAG: NDP-sugar synthase [Deferrisomatales bacterium]